MTEQEEVSARSVVKALTAAAECRAGVFRVTIYSTARRHVVFFSWENPTLPTQEVKIILAPRRFNGSYPFACL